MEKQENLQKIDKNNKKSSKKDESILKTSKVDIKIKNSKKLQKKQQKFAKKQQKREKKDAKNKKSRGGLWFVGVSFVAVGILLFCQFFFGDFVGSETTFYENSSINGIDVSGLNTEQSASVVSAKMLSQQDEISLTLTFEDEEYTFEGSDFEFGGDLQEPIYDIISSNQQGNIFERRNKAKKAQSEGARYKISYSQILQGIDARVDEVIEKVERPEQEEQIIFSPDEEELFSISEAEIGVKVDKEELLHRIDLALYDKNAVVEIPTYPILPNKELSELEKDIALRSSFSTSYATSKPARKNNVALALSAFNGMIVAPDETISFNETTGARTEENGYEKANIIVGGVYVNGVGGGVCQASTTLYNALLLADVEVVSVTHHTLPASYVPLSFDAMVSEGYADLVFKNTTGLPIYIRTSADAENVTVEIYGLPFDEGEEVSTRSELVRVLYHGGDKIVVDVDGQYSDHVLYQGEYYRLKYPREGYESKGYVVKMKDGEIVSERQVRHDYYYPQDGIIIEGSETLGEGMSLPSNDVKIIPPQTKSSSDSLSLKYKLEKENPSSSSQ